MDLLNTQYDCLTDWKKKEVVQKEKEKILAFNKAYNEAIADKLKELYPEAYPSTSSEEQVVVPKSNVPNKVSESDKSAT